jgi:glycosyltransferase involved in cell wall biosynthesis
MRIVIVSPAVPHPFGETGARSLYVLVTGLLARGAAVACLVANQESGTRVGEARELLERVPGAKNLELSVFPLAAPPVAIRRLRSAWRPFSETLYAVGVRRALERERSAGYDVLHLEQLWSGWAGVNFPRTILSIHQLDVIDSECRRLESFGERKAMLQMRRATRMILRASRSVRVLTERLHERARQIHPEAEYWVIPLALDVSLYAMQPVSREAVVGLLGSMHWFPSRSAAERLLTSIWPRVKRRLPGARLLIGGWNARRYLEHQVSDSSITLIDNIAHPSEFFSRIAVMAYAPRRGSGMKVKVLESMAYGVPVVTTAEGVEGIDYEDGVHCVMREDDEALATAIVDLLTDEPQRVLMAEAARALIESRYSPAPVLSQMLAAYDRVRRG